MSRINADIEESNSIEESSKELKCGECEENSAIYQCPRCSHRTCSLECCRGHKTRTGCSGKRDRSAFLPICQMNESTLRSDFFFLEEAMGQIPKHGKRMKLDAAQNGMSKKRRRLLQQAERRGVVLQLMPPIMERHKSNSSWYCAPRDMITWRLDVIVYPDRKLFHLQISENDDNILSRIQGLCELQKHPLQGSFRLFLKQLPSSAKEPRFTEVFECDTLRKSLDGMTIIEYPTIHCVPGHQADQFPVGTGKILEVAT